MELSGGSTTCDRAVRYVTTYECIGGLKVSILIDIHECLQELLDDDCTNVRA